MGKLEKLGFQGGLSKSLKGFDWCLKCMDLDVHDF